MVVSNWRKLKSNKKNDRVTYANGKKIILKIVRSPRIGDKPLYNVKVYDFLRSVTNPSKMVIVNKNFTDNRKAVEFAKEYMKKHKM